MNDDVKKGIAALAVVAALGGGAYEGLVSDGAQDHPLTNEVVSKRTENSVTIKADSSLVVMEDGSAKWVPRFNARVYAAPIHFKNDRGEWKQIDTTLKPKPFILRALSSRPYEVTSGVYHAEFSGEKEYNYRFSNNGASVEYEARFDTTEAVSIDIETTRAGVKETIILFDESAPTRLEWGLTIEGSEVREEPGGWGVYNTDGQLGFLIQAATARDAKGKEIPVRTTLTKDLLVTEVDAKDAVYPVTVDPTTTVTVISTTSGRVYYLAASTYLNARDATSGNNAGAGEIYYIGQQKVSASDYNVFRSFMSFPLGSLGTCSACTLYVDGAYDGSDTDFNMNVFGARKYKSTITTADFQNFDGWASSGAYTGTELINTWSTSSYSADWNALIFNEAGLDSLLAASSDTLWVALISSRDSSSTTPTAKEYLWLSVSPAPYISFTYTPAPINSPTEFLMTPITGARDSLLLSWVTNSTPDSIILRTWPDSVFVAYLTKTATSARIGGLNPYQKYKWYIRADAGGAYGYSNADTCYTCQTFKTENFSLLNNGYTQNNATAVYDSARGEIKADSLAQGDGYIGQWKDVANAAGDGANMMYIFREYMDFALPALTKVSAESLIVAGNTDSSVTNFNIVARSGLWHGSTTDDAKYYTFDGWAAQMGAYTGTTLTSSYSTAGYTTGATLNRIPFTQAGRDTTLKRRLASDSLRVILLSSNDVSATAPTLAEYVWITVGSSYLKLTYAPPDSAPGSLVLTSISSDSLLASWTDHSYSERGFILVENVGGAKVAGTDTTLQDVTSLRVGGLSTNTSYTWKVKAVGGGADGLLSAADSCYTRAATPGKPTVTFPADSLLKFVLDVNANPAYTEFAVQDSISGKYVDYISGVSDTLAAAAEWRTYANWGGLAGDILKVGVGKKYIIRVKARSGQ